MPEKLDYRPRSRACAIDDWGRPRSRVSNPRHLNLNPGTWKRAAYKSETLHLQKPQLLPSEEAAFRRLVEEWRRATSKSSSIAKKVMHPAYQRIIGMGPTALPLILQEMKRRPGHWFWALDAITQGESPTESWETLEEATAAWIRWGEAKGYL